MDGVIPLLVLSGALTPENSFGVSISILAGPAALITAATVDGEIKIRVISALLAGLLATVAVVIAAVLGDKLETFLDVRVLRVFAAIALCTIALQIVGVNLPTKLPMIIVLIGILFSFLFCFG